MGLFDRFRKRKNQEQLEENKIAEPEKVIEEEVEDQFVFPDDEPAITDSNDLPANKVESKPKKAPTKKKTSPTPKIAEEEVDNPLEIQQDEEVSEVYDAGLAKTRSSFADRFNKLMTNFRTVDEDFFENLEETLISADVGFEMALKISDELRDEVKLQNAKKKEDVQNIIIEKLISTYENAGGDVDAQMQFAEDGQPTVFLFVGVNGVGKTTTIGKMAAVYKKKGKKVLLAAADTFRAGAVKQLVEWGERDGVEVVTGKENGDPASVVFDAVKKAKSENYDLLIVDTAGRLQNNVNLMQELTKMKKVIERELPDAPQEVLLVLDATTGQNALQQARLFKDSSDVTGMVLTKVDGTAKGGIILAIRQDMKLPVKWLGLGEKVDDLQFFDSEEFIYGLFKDLIEI